MSVEGWKTKALGSVAEIIMGQSPDSRYYSEEEIGLPFLQGCAEFTSKFPSAVLFCSQVKKIARTGSILFSVRAPVGRTNLTDTDYIIGRGLAALIASQISQDYLHHYLVYSESGFRNNSQGSTFEAINSKELRDWAISFPEFLQEQTQIATILSTIDRAIEQTEALIAKQQRIKTGLMQDLLTKGIDENGNIRSEETHEFKDSPLGRIPVEWEVSQLRDTGTWLSGGTPSKSEKTYWGPFVPWVCSKDMKVFDLKNTLEMITQKGVLSGSKVAPKDSVLIVVRGMILAHTFPVVYLTRDMAFNQDIKAIIPNENIYGRYLAYWFSANSSQLLKLTTTATHGTKRLETNDLLEFALCLPSKMEQKKIIYLLDKSQYDIEITKEYLQKLKLQKTGLMQDLLTGKVRVTDLLNQKTAAN